MPTPFDEIIDLALVTVDDYKLVKVFKQNLNEFQDICDGFLIRAIPYFTQCRQSLKYDAENRVFSSELTQSEISILADLWVLQWFKRETQNSAKINALLQLSGGFKTHSASQNLKEKGIYLDSLREKVNQKIIEYQLEDISNIEI